MENNVLDVVVIGGGISGLAAALELKDSGCESFCVLEARGKVGGRTCSEMTERGCRVDAGGAYVGPDQNYLHQLLERFILHCYPVYEKGKNVSIDHGKRMEYSGLIPPFNVVALLDINGLLVELQQLADEVDLEKPWKTKNAEALDRISLGQWVDAKGMSETAKKTLFASFSSLTCTNPYELSLLWILWMVRSTANVKCLMGIKEGAQEQKVVEGTAELSARIAKQVGNIKTNKPVKEIDYSSPQHIKITCNDGSVFYALQVIIAMSPTLYNTMSFNPVLPFEKSQLSQHMPMGSIIKTNTYYERAFWRESGMSGFYF